MELASLDVLPVPGRHYSVEEMGEALARRRSLRRDGAALGVHTEFCAAVNLVAGRSDAAEPAAAEAFGDLDERLTDVIRARRDLSRCCADVFRLRSEEIVLRCLERLFDAGLSPKATGLEWGGASLLSLAARTGCVPAVRRLLEAGASLNTCDMFGFTPLKEALQSAGGLEAVSVLVSAGARIDESCFQYAYSGLFGIGPRDLRAVGENRGRIGVLLLAPQLDVEDARRAAARLERARSPRRLRLAAELRAAAGWGAARRAWAGAVARVAQR